MPFKCFTCGLNFNTVAEFSEHSLVHQKQSEDPEDKNINLVCLKCGKPIHIDSLEANYKGIIACPGCKQTVRVVMRNGEVEIAISTMSAEQTKEDLLKQYHNSLLKYAEAKDLIDSLVPALAGEKIQTITATQDLLAKFYYAAATMTTILSNIQEIHEKLLRLQHN